LVEAITGNATSTIGMFASHAWSIQPSSYGDGECFLFRANPNPKCFNWTPDFSGNMDDMENQAVREQFMVARSDFIGAGVPCYGLWLRLQQAVSIELLLLFRCWS